jgi:hypothetical protein
MNIRKYAIIFTALLATTGTAKSEGVPIATSWFKLQENKEGMECLIRARNNDDPDAIEICNIPDDEVLGAMNLLVVLPEHSWAQKHCVPRVPRGFRCEERGFWMNCSSILRGRC